VPELPEVEVVRRGLERWASGRTIADAEVLHPRAVRRHTAGAADFAGRLRGHRFGPARRRGKYLWLPLDPGFCVLAHLGMSGQLLIQPTGTPDEKHLRIRITFEDPSAGELRFVDQRTFGGLSLHPETADGIPDVIAHIARDPLDPAFDDDAFHSALRHRRTTIKRALLDQSLISGVGNIYADEALFRARVHPLRPAGALTGRQWDALAAAVRETLLAGLAAGGATIDDFRNAEGVAGGFQDEFLVHRRQGDPCPVCGTPVVKFVAGGRGTYACERCQPRPRVRRRAR
jgi:formamidopyrimidine-DNA glycosylase